MEGLRINGRIRNIFPKFLWFLHPLHKTRWYQYHIFSKRCLKFHHFKIFVNLGQIRKATSHICVRKMRTNGIENNKNWRSLWIKINITFISLEFLQKWIGYIYMQKYTSLIVLQVVIATITNIQRWLIFFIFRYSYQIIIFI